MRRLFNVCPEGIILKGDGGFPEVNFLQGECTFCQKCVESCDQNLFVKIAEVPSDNAWNSDISIKSDCLAATDVVVRVVKIAVKLKLSLLGVVPLNRRLFNKSVIHRAFEATAFYGNSNSH
jgi:Fe-S-cluster-containing hydrogenase component 2